MERKSRVREGINLDGVIRISKWEGKKTPIVQIHHNTMSEYAIESLLALSASLYLNGAAATPFGTVVSTTPGYILKSNQYYSGTAPLGLTVYFLKLDDDELEDLNSQTVALPIYDMNGNFTDKVVAYGTQQLVNSGKITGIASFSDPTIMLKPNACSLGWQFEADNGAFEYNCIAIAQRYGSDVFESFKCISRCNTLQTGAELTKRFVIPGFSSITGANEILLDYTYDNRSKWKYNLKTGETTAVESNEDAYSFDMSDIGNIQLVFNNILYSNGISKTGYVYVRDSTGTVLKTMGSTSITYNGIFTDGTDVYLSGADTNFYKIDQSTYATTKIAKSSFELLGNLPSDWTIGNVYIRGSYVENDIRYYIIGCSGFGTWIVSDLSNVAGSVVTKIYREGTTVNIDNTPEGTFTIVPGSSATQNSHTIYDPDSSKVVTIDYTNLGVWINNNRRSNFLSFKKYSELQQKTIAQNLYITYGYEVGLL